MSVVRLMIAGLPRCGTTLLASLLNQQRGCRFITDYVHWFHTAFNRLGATWDTPLSMEQRRVCLAVARDEWLRLGHPVLVSTGDFRTVDELHRAISAELVSDDVRAIGHKALLDVPTMEAALRSTDIELILMVRDPRAAAFSYRNRFGGGVSHYLESWKRTVNWARVNPAITLLRYEDLILEPLATLGRCTLAWGEEPQIPDALRFQNRSRGTGVQWTENSAFGDVKGLLDRTPPDRWRKHTTEPTIQYANAVCEDAMQWLGYRPLPDQRVSTKARMRLFETYRRLDERADALWHRARRYVRTRLDVLDET